MTNRSTSRRREVAQVGHRAPFQNIRLFGEMSVLEKRDGRAPRAHQGWRFRCHLPYASRASRGNAKSPTAPASCWTTLVSGKRAGDKAAHLPAANSGASKSPARATDPK